MASDVASRRLYMVGVLEGWRENTTGADAELAELQAKIMRGDVKWIGRDPSSKRKKSAPRV